MITLAAIAPGASVWADDRPAKPAEEIRFSAAAFRAGLRKRGLTELLDLHLREFPPASRTATLLMRRDLRLAEYGDAKRPREERMAAVAQANRLLTELVDGNPEDRRRFDWQFTLAHSLLYDEGEPFFTRILYRGGSHADRLELRALTTRAVDVLDALIEGLAAEYERIDGLSIRKFDELERSGYVDGLDRLMPRADYLLLWALYYDSLSRDDDDPTRASRLNRIREALIEEPAILETSHTISRVQVQALVLAGMTYRLLNDHSTAREYFSRALGVANRLGDPAERERIGWAVTLARIERVRNDRDDGRFDDAVSGLRRFRETISEAARGGDEFGLLLVAALLERSVHQARAVSAEQEGRGIDTRRFREKAWKPLAQLAWRHPEKRDEIYATLYELIGPQADPTQLDPFEQCALVAGLLSEADRDPGSFERSLDRAIEVGSRFASGVPEAAASLVPEVLYNLAVAQYRRGHVAQAAMRFLEVARDHPGFDNALDAATFAVQLASSLYEDGALRDRPDVQRLYQDALEILLGQYSDTDAARYWRFYYAQLLDELGRYEQAAAQFALVDAGHEHHLESIFFHVRSVAFDLTQRCRAASRDALAVRRLLDEFFSLQRDFVTRATDELPGEVDAVRNETLRKLIGRATLLGAEIKVLPQVDRPVNGLNDLADFESTYPGLSALTGRVWRVRLVAYEKLGRLEEAARAIPTYVAADPVNAGPVLQSLYVALAQDVKEARADGDENAAQRKAELSLLLAQQIYGWAEQYKDASTPIERRQLTVQLAEANLLAGQYERALELFEQGGAGRKAAAILETPTDVAVAFGHAEALYRLARYAEALPEFNRLAVQLPEADPIRWESLLRDLQCRTELGQPARDVIKVIEQQRYLFPDLGGPPLAEEFEKLLRENQRRPNGP
jgi:tetratricopeptide (TPR) repeat protein